MKEVCILYGLRPVGTAAGALTPGEIGRGDLARWGSRAEGGPRGGRPREEACLGGPRAVTGAGEVGQKCEEEREGGSGTQR